MVQQAETIWINSARTTMDYRNKCGNDNFRAPHAPHAEARALASLEAYTASAECGASITIGRVNFGDTPLYSLTRPSDPLPQKAAGENDNHMGLLPFLPTGEGARQGG
jgi:hypothetical protein